MTESFTVYRGNLKIRGRVFAPDFGRSYPALIISHEFGSDMISTSRYAVSLFRSGYAVFIYDFCGSGSGISDGRSTDMSVFTEKEDLSAVLDFVKAQSYVDARNISLIGCSQGGLVSALLAAERENEINKLILCYPALCIPDDAHRGSMLGAKFNPDNPPEKFRALYVKLGRCYIDAALSLEPWKEICSYSKPVLILHGDKDSIVPFEYAEKASEKYPDAKLVRIRNAKHMFPLTACITAISEIKKFL